jgi:hypothetical protein
MSEIFGFVKYGRHQFFQRKATILSGKNRRICLWAVWDYGGGKEDNLGGIILYHSRLSGIVQGSKEGYQKSWHDNIGGRYKSSTLIV